MELIRVTKDILEKEHICCAISNNKDVQVMSKKAWLAELLSIALDWNYMPSGARFTGFCIGMLGDLVFLISVIFIKDSWRAGIPESDKTKLVTDGFYKYSRNPAFFGFDLM